MFIPWYYTTLYLLHDLLLRQILLTPSFVNVGWTAFMAALRVFTAVEVLWRSASLPLDTCRLLAILTSDAIVKENIKKIVKISNASLKRTFLRSLYDKTFHVSSLTSSVVQINVPVFKLGDYSRTKYFSIYSNKLWRVKKNFFHNCLSNQWC